MTLAALVDDFMVTVDILLTPMPQPLSKQILTPSLPHKSWEPGEHQPASSTPVKLCFKMRTELSKL